MSHGEVLVRRWEEELEEEVEEEGAEEAEEEAEEWGVRKRR